LFIGLFLIKTGCCVLLTESAGSLIFYPDSIINF